MKSELEVEDEYVFRVHGPVDLTFLSKLANIEGYSELKFSRMIPNSISELKDRSIFEVLREKDILLHHPFQSFDPIVKMVQQAADDPKSISD